jgi:hypothetical protein
VLNFVFLDGQFERLEILLSVVDVDITRMGESNFFLIYGRSIRVEGAKQLVLTSPPI